MPQPVWRKIISEKAIPEAQGIPWTLVMESPTPGKLMKIEVLVDLARNPPTAGTWTPQDFANACTADGDITGVALGARQSPGTPLIASAPIGALIGRIGGSTADQTLDNGTPPARIGFAVGRICILSVPDKPVGALFLGVNDAATRMAGLTGSLVVNIYEAI